MTRLELRNTNPPEAHLLVQCRLATKQVTTRPRNILARRVVMNAETLSAQSHEQLGRRPTKIGRSERATRHAHYSSSRYGRHCHLLPQSDFLDSNLRRMDTREQTVGTLGVSVCRHRLGLACQVRPPRSICLSQRGSFIWWFGCWVTAVPERNRCHFLIVSFFPSPPTLPIFFFLYRALGRRQAKVTVRPRSSQSCEE